MIWLSVVLVSVVLGQVVSLDRFESLFGFNLTAPDETVIRKRSIGPQQNPVQTSSILSLPIPLQYIRPCTSDSGFHPCFSSGKIIKEGFQIDYYAGISAVLKKSDLNKKSKKQKYLNLPIPIEYIPSCDMKNGLKPCIFVGEWKKGDMVVCYYIGIAKVSKCDKPEVESSRKCTPETWWYCPTKKSGKAKSSRRSGLEGLLVDMIEKAPIPK